MKKDLNFSLFYSLRLYLRSGLICFFLFYCCSVFTEMPDTSKCSILKAIQDRGKLIVGTYNDDPYFSFLNPQNQQLEGFDIEMAHALAKELLGDANRVKFVIVTSRNRISSLQEGKVDLILAEMTINEERQKVVDFSDIYYMAGQSILVKANQPLYALQDLYGKKIGVIFGSTTVAHIKQIVPHTELIPFNTLSAALQALAKNQIQALSIDDVTLAALQSNSQDFITGYRFVGGEISWEAYGIAIQKGCPEFLQIINKALKKIKDEGRWQQIYDQTIKPISHVSAGPPN